MLSVLLVRFCTPLAVYLLAPLARLNGPLADERCTLGSDLNSTTVSNDTVGPIIIDRLDLISVTVIASGVHRTEQFTDNVAFLNCLIRPIKKRSILPTIPNYRVQFVGDIVPAHMYLCTVAQFEIIDQW